MCLTYDDGAEDEVLDLWIDLALGDGSVPADPESWLRSLNVRSFFAFSSSAAWATATSTAGLLPAFRQPFVISDWSIVPTEDADTRGFLRFRLDVSERRLTRAGLYISIINSTSALDSWTPNRFRVQARLATCLPSHVRTSRPCSCT